MKPGLPIARLLAAMILAIVAWAAPSAGQAHDGGHAVGLHHAHHRAPTEWTTASPDLLGPGAVAQVAVSLVAVSPVVISSARIARVRSEPAVATASLLPDEADRADRAGADGLCCCGAACCAPGILAAGVSLPGPATGRVRLRPADAPARAALGPASLSEPPRTFA